MTAYCKKDDRPLQLMRSLHKSQTLFHVASLECLGQISTRVSSLIGQDGSLLAKDTRGVIQNVETMCSMRRWRANNNLIHALL